MASPDDMTTGVRSVSIPVPDQDAALEFYTTVLGCEVTYDGEPIPGARIVEVVPPGSDVGIVLLPPGSPYPMAVRLGTGDAQAAYDRLRDSAATLHNDEVLRWEGSPAMFSFADPQGNALVYLEDPPG